MSNIVDQMTTRELLEAFPEAEEILERNRKMYESDLTAQMDYIKALYTVMIQNNPGIEDSDNWWFFREYTEREMNKTSKNLRFVKNLLRRVRNFSLGVEDTTAELIHIARSKPIEQVLMYLGLQVSNNFFNCIFHNEKTASCKVYPDSNSFYCFGCHKSGDSITLVMHKEDVSFHYALNLLKDL